MLKRWLPTDRNLRRALYGLLVFVLCIAAAGGVESWDREHNRGEKGREAVAQAVWQFGPTSQQAADAVAQMGQSAGLNDLVALLDPATGKAIAAWPADLAGKRPEEMAPSNGLKLPPLEKLMGRRQFELRTATTNGTKLEVRLDPLYPTGALEGENHGEGGFGRQGRGFGFEGNRTFEPRGGFGREGQDGFGRGLQQGEFRGEQGGLPQAPPTPPTPPTTPEAILLLATPPQGVTPIRVVAAGLGALGALGFVTYWLSIAWWVFADARRRGSKGFAWGVLALLTNLVGAAVYLVARREQRTCTRCGANMERSFNNCPHCGQSLKRHCDKCGQVLRTGWTHCANCGTGADSAE
jgi:predicted RNA-binding Zn-ribbon protein involved in translation (DUF1610 family)